MKKTFVLALVLALCVSLLAGCGPTGGDSTEPPVTTTEAVPTSQVKTSVPEGTILGKRCRDFTFTTYDGKTYSLYEVLQEKKMVLINMWATWCGPCRSEFPYMEQAYEQYKDDVEIFALSCEATDTDEVLADYVADMGMTFPVGRDAPNVYADFTNGYIPISVVVDRYGIICFKEDGSQPSAELFARLFDVFVSDDYPESVLLEEIPPKVPDVTPASAEELAAALNVEGGSLTFANPDGEYEWPMVICNEDGRTFLKSTNQGQGDSISYVTFQATAQEGDVLSLDFKLSSEAGCDILGIYVDGKSVKRYSDVFDWTTFTYELTAGEHTFKLAYEKDPYTDTGDDCVCLDNIAILAATPTAPADTTAPAGTSDYTIEFVDQNGEPVEGVTVNICDDASCTPMESDANGMVSFVYPSFAYHIQVIVVPEGYEYDTTQESYLEEAGGVTQIVITKK